MINTTFFIIHKFIISVKTSKFYTLNETEYATGSIAPTKPIIRR
jgi:hypothetical protein